MVSLFTKDIVQSYHNNVLLMLSVTPNLPHTNCDIYIYVNVEFPKYIFELHTFRFG